MTLWKFNAEERPSGTEADPVRTCGGDTILRIPPAYQR